MQEAQSDNHYHGHHLHLGWMWLAFFLAATLLAVKELVAIFGTGLVIQPAMGIVVGTITAFFLLVSLVLRDSMDAQSSFFAPMAADAQGRVETAASLARLPGRYFTFNDLTFKELKIDHIVLSSLGCILIYTRGILGEPHVEAEGLQIDGKDADSLVTECWYQAHCLQVLIRERFDKEIDVTPVLCLPRMEMGASLVAKGVSVTNLTYLTDVIERFEDGIIDRSFVFILSGYLGKAASGVQ